MHVETCPEIATTLKAIKSLGCLAGVTLNPSTPASGLEVALPLADIVLVLTVHPGYSGQEFIPAEVAKVAEIRRSLDGGISVQTICQVRDAGADAFVAASAVFKNPAGIAAGIQALKNAITN